MKRKIKFTLTADKLPPKDGKCSKFGDDVSIPCRTIVDGKVFDKPLFYLFEKEIWVELALGFLPSNQQSNVTEWMPWEDS